MPANLFTPLPAIASEEEEFTQLLARPGLTIERIVSTGQASPAGFWYDQATEEWVLVLAGEATLRLENEAESRHLRAGDYVYLPAHCRHRVEWTAPDQPTIWLAVHYAGPDCPGGNESSESSESSLSQTL